MWDQQKQVSSRLWWDQGEVDTLGGGCSEEQWGRRAECLVTDPKGSRRLWWMEGDSNG